MTLTILFAPGDALWNNYRAPLIDALDAAGLNAVLTREADPETVDYIVYAPGSALTDFSPFTRCCAVLNLWAGVERIVGNPTLHQPLCRMVDPALTQGMVEYVTGHVLRYHLGLDDHITRQDGVWRPEAPPLASQRQVAMLGLGALGQTCARALAGLGFAVDGWARTARTVPGVTCHAGPEGLQNVLSRAEIVVTLLPRTPGTENLLDADRLSLLPRGARLINPGRGHLIDDDALLAVLDSGQVAHATLDVFRMEPLPAEHPFWAHPRVTVTPHIAAETRPHSAAQVIVDNIVRGQAGQPFVHRVDPATGY
ncbi:2-hydroxyacid dehydrogenase [Roseicitreum antarcticum]|uniref:Glyoxylate/hydroxypyruvate reductase A n=1 Tax=Roseicitreum antarcticum TaxID=564137 RepID=A0A1H3BJR0_9RHOB|nr:glyoxylate/hydroxypyruvate reductase A [Roseicitreum antarcticum]SDX42153.1 glyoxylate/hydroxypyruvate reductase A [Roseicitreum antarcticum]